MVESEKPNVNRVGIKQNKFIMTSTENYILVEFVSEKGSKFAIDILNLKDIQKRILISN